MGQKVIGEIQVKMDKNLEKETTPGKTIKILSTFKKILMFERSTRSKRSKISTRFEGSARSKRSNQEV